MITFPAHILVIDVESVGLHGEPFQVGGIVVDTRDNVVLESTRFCYSCYHKNLPGKLVDFEWLDDNLPQYYENCSTQKEMIKNFVKAYKHLKDMNESLVIAYDCGYPVEANFLNLVCKESGLSFYPTIEISTAMYMVGINPMQTFQREDYAMPRHHALTDARHSAHQLMEIIKAAKLFNHFKAGELMHHKIFLPES